MAAEPDLIDRCDFTPEQLALWDCMFPKGITHETSETDSAHMRLYAYGYVAMLECGSTPESVMNELGDLPRLVNEYMANVRRARGKSARQTAMSFDLGTRALVVPNRGLRLVPAR